MPDPAFRIGSGAVRTHVERNWLGLDASGTIAAPNRGYGVLVWESADETLIGGGPTFLSTLVGTMFDSVFVFVGCLALAAGAILYVLGELLPVGRRL